jgi:hypothetical protein
MAEQRGPFKKFVDSRYYSRVGTLWRCGDGLFFEVPPPLASDALLTTLHPPLESVNRLSIGYFFMAWYLVKSPFFLNHPLLPCGVKGFLLVNL